MSGDIFLEGSGDPKCEFAITELSYLPVNQWKQSVRICFLEKVPPATYNVIVKNPEPIEVPDMHKKAEQLAVRTGA